MCYGQSGNAGGLGTKRWPRWRSRRDAVNVKHDGCLLRASNGSGLEKLPPPNEKWALQQREKRAQLVQALKHENDLNRIACTLENLNPDWAGALFEVNIRVRELAEQMVAKAGTATVLLKCSFALQSIGLRFALNALGCSRSTIYRKFSGRLDSLRTDGEILRAYDLSQVDTQIGSKPRRPSAEETENAWSVQTTSSPENFRAVSH
jgi:hypothetical protein